MHPELYHKCFNTAVCMHRMCVWTYNKQAIVFSGQQVQISVILIMYCACYTASTDKCTVFQNLNCEKSIEMDLILVLCWNSSWFDGTPGDAVSLVLLE